LKRQRATFSALNRVLRPMHSAPSVSYPVGRSRFLACVLAVLWLTGAALTALSWLRGPLVGWNVAISCAAVLSAGLMTGQFWRRMPCGELRWDGRGWQGPGGSSVPRSIRVHLDLQRHLLVSLHGPASAGRWLWLSASSQPDRWNDLRRAVYSRAMTDAQRNTANQ
jgi:hypothetical protein